MVQNTRKFFELLFPHIDKYIQIKVAFNDKWEFKNFSFHKDINSLMDKLSELEPECDVYFGYGTRRVMKGDEKFINSNYSLCIDVDSHNLDLLRHAVKKLGVQPSIIVNSGHGYHLYWLLEEPIKDVKAFKQIEKALIKHFLDCEVNADPKVCNASGVLRVPGTYNNKYNRRCKVEILEMKEIRYSIKLFLDKLSSYLRTDGEQIRFELLSYKEINIDKVNMACVRNMLCGVEEGSRNFACGRIVKYFQRAGYKFPKIKNIIIEWNSKNNPPLPQDVLNTYVKAYMDKDYKLLGCQINIPGNDDPNKAHLQSILSRFCNKNECSFSDDVLNLSINDSIKINNRIFRHYKRISGVALIILGLIAMHPEGLTRKQIGELMNRNADKDKLFCSELKFLVQEGLIKRCRGVKKKGIPDLYIPCESDYGMGFTLINNLLIDVAIYNIISLTELKFYILLRSFCYTKAEGECFPSVRRIAEIIGCEERNVYVIINKLIQKRYIKKTLKQNERGQLINHYILLK